MAKRKGSGGGSRGLGMFALGFLFCVVVLVIAGYLELRFGSLPVAVADAPFPLEKQIVSLPLHARIDSELKTPPFGTSEDVYEAGAHVYRQQCAGCHGVPGRDVGYAKFMYPEAPQLWKKHAHSAVVGVSDDEAGETYWKVDHGIRLSGMPAYHAVLTTAQMWQVSLLLKHADEDLPEPVRAILVERPGTP